MALKMLIYFLKLAIQITVIIRQYAAFENFIINIIADFLFAANLLPPLTCSHNCNHTNN